MVLHFFSTLVSQTGRFSGQLKPSQDQSLALSLCCIVFSTSFCWNVPCIITGDHVRVGSYEVAVLACMCLLSPFLLHLSNRYDVSCFFLLVGDLQKGAHSHNGLVATLLHLCSNVTGNCLTWVVSLWRRTFWSVPNYNSFDFFTPSLTTCFIQKICANIVKFKSFLKNFC